jgi:hypothetical protein
MNLSRLDVAAVSRALDDHDPDRDHFLDAVDGSVWTFVFSEATDETRERREAVLQGLGKTHVLIPARSPQEAFEEIEDFVERVEDAAAREALFRAIERKGAFRNFREALLEHPEEHRRWRAERSAASRRRLGAFLDSLGIERMESAAGGPV